MNLSNEQKKAVSHVEGPALILAVPGAGKTTVLIHRTANLILNHNIKPERVLSITFSKASAKDMKSRFNKLYGDICYIPVHFSTIHSFSYSLIKEYAYINKIKYRFIDDSRNKINKYNILKQIHLSINNSYVTEDELETIINAIGYIKNMLITPVEYLEKFEMDVHNFKDIFNKYENYKRDNNFIDFDDMLTLSLEILQNDSYLLQKYRNRYDYIQVDEAQDTSKVQMEIIKILAAPKNNLFIVADDDQSIYGFRGAYPKGLFDFNKIYKNGKIFYMEENYRSSNNIVSICNKFIKKNTLRYDKNIFTKNNFVEPINIVKVNKLDDQYNYIVEELQNKENHRDSAILYRNNMSAIGIIEYLDRNNIPFYMRDMKTKFFNHWVVYDIIDFFKLAEDTSNIESFERIYYKMKGYISRKQINYIKKLNYNQSVFDRLLDFPGINRFYRNNFNELKKDFKILSGLNPYDTICYIEYELEYEDYLRESSMKLGHTLDFLKSVLCLIKIIASGTEDFNQFLQRLKYLENISKKSKNVKNGVTLSTLHSAKGLEFKNVYMIDLIEGDFPNNIIIEEFDNGNIQALEEERRLFYVGMTRAKEHLSLVTVNNKNNKPVDSSRFLIELESLIS